MTATTFVPGITGEWTIPAERVDDVRVVLVRSVVDLLTEERIDDTHPRYLGRVTRAAELADVLTYIGVPGDRLSTGRYQDGSPMPFVLTRAQGFATYAACRRLARFIDRNRAELLDPDPPNPVRREWLETFIAPCAAGRRVVEGMVFS